MITEQSASIDQGPRESGFACTDHVFHKAAFGTRGQSRVFPTSGQYPQMKPMCLPKRDSSGALCYSYRDYSSHHASSLIRLLNHSASALKPVRAQKVCMRVYRSASSACHYDHGRESRENGRKQPCPTSRRTTFFWDNRGKALAPVTHLWHDNWEGVGHHRPVQLIEMIAAVHDAIESCAVLDLAVVWVSRERGLAINFYPEEMADLVAHHNQSSPQKRCLLLCRLHTDWPRKLFVIPAHFSLFPSEISEKPGERKCPTLFFSIGEPKHEVPLGIRINVCHCQSNRAVRRSDPSLVFRKGVDLWSWKESRFFWRTCRSL